MTEPQPLTQEQKDQLRTIAVEITAKVLSYKLLRKLGASPWQAWVSTIALFRLNRIVEILDEIAPPVEESV